MANDILRFVQVESNVAVIDSRVYCRDVIEVHHGDWLKDTVEKYKADVEELFGVIRAKTRKPPKGSQGGRPEKYLLLTEQQFKYFLSKTRKRLSKDIVDEFDKYGWDIKSYLGVNPKRLKNKESAYSNALSKSLGGKREVKTLAGNIDILTNTEIIEVKCVSAWKSALGQVLVYGDYYPSHQKRIHVYGETQESYLQMIQKHCAIRKVIVTWEL